MRELFAVARALTALALVVAVAGRLLVHLRFWIDRGDQQLAVDVVNFFSYFTIQSSLFHAVVLVLGVRVLRGRRGAEPPWLGALRAAATTYTVTTGVVYNALLRQVPLEPGLEQPWANEVLHTVVPVYALVDWVFAPGRRPVPWRTVGWIVAYPVVWAAATLLRAPTILDEGTGNPWWYPYPFLDPHASAGGYGAVALWVAVLAVAVTALACAVVGLSRAGRRGRARPASLTGPGRTFPRPGGPGRRGPRRRGR
ncbi:Pr6Pr family membrane protein [Kocuria flava]|uniref:Pr6Pr family membrane protein n=1 Tax=Kocuria flava TaxID=446860 RepID=UPI001FF2B874|nr:Pr6Pr family membrane protein [Kocuria flava]MCJ8503457.1 Pr6Pr family membrane protein [Kocuria flava]